MPRAVYSTRFLLQTLATSAIATYTVPAGMRAVVRSWGFGKTTAVAASAYLRVGPATGSLVDVAADGTATVTAVQKNVNGIVVNSGEVISVQCVTGTMVVNVSGYLLTN